MSSLGSRITWAKTVPIVAASTFSRRVRALRVADVDHHRAARLEVVVDLLEELLGDQVERDVGLAVGVHHDRVPAPVGGPQEGPGVGRVEVQVGAAQVEQPAAHVGERAVDLDAVHAGVAGSSGRRRGRWSRRRRPGSRSTAGRGRRRAAAPGTRPSSCRSATCPGRYTEWIAWPSFSSSRRAPSGRSTTRAYWYWVSLSQITRPSPVSFSVADGQQQQRRRRRAGRPRRGAGRPEQRATSPSAAAKTRKVRRVPANGISSSAARNTPARLPSVEIAYSRPLTRPASSTDVTVRRIA